MDRKMLARQHDMAKELVDRHLKGGMDRRDLLKRAGMLGISVPALSAALGARGAIGQGATPSTDEDVQLGNYDGETLRVSIALAETEAEVFRETVVAGFEATTGGDVEVVNIESEDVLRTLEAQVGSDNVAIDLLVQDNNTLAPLVARELVEELPEAEELMPETTIEAIKEVLQFDGSYWFLPARPNVQITYYNSASFEEYGVEPPQTWDELMAVAQTIQEQAGVGQVSIQGVSGGPVGVTMTQYLWQAGGDPLNLGTEEAQQAFQFVQDLEPYLTPQYPTATFDTTNTYILNQSVVLAKNWPFGINVIVEDGGMEEVLTYAGWEGPAGNALVLGGDVFGVAAGTPNREMALDFTRYWMTLGVQEQLTSLNGWPPMRSDALGQVEVWQQPYFETVTEALEFSRPRPNVEYWLDVENILTSAFTDIVVNGQDVAETLDRYQSEMEELTNGE